MRMAHTWALPHSGVYCKERKKEMIIAFELTTLPVIKTQHCLIGFWGFGLAKYPYTKMTFWLYRTQTHTQTRCIRCWFCEYNVLLWMLCTWWRLMNDAFECRPTCISYRIYHIYIYTSIQCLLWFVTFFAFVSFLLQWSSQWNGTPNTIQLSTKCNEWHFFFFLSPLICMFVCCICVRVRPHDHQNSNSHPNNARLWFICYIWPSCFCLLLCCRAVLYIVSAAAHGLAWLYRRTYIYY